jgi:WD40 repeat protein
VNCVNCVQLSPDGRQSVSANNDTTVRAWNVATAETQTLTGHTDRVLAAPFSPDGQKIVSASGRPLSDTDTTGRIWSVVTGECEQTMKGHSSQLNSAAFSVDGRQIVSASQDRTVRVWDAAMGEGRRRGVFRWPTKDDRSPTSAQLPVR